MMKAFRGIAALVVALAVPLGSFAQNAPDGLPGAVVPEGFGVNIHFTEPQSGEMERFAEAGFGVARMDFFWNQIETIKGMYDFSAYDRLTERLRKAGARPLYILDYGNDLYEKGSPRSPEARAAFARFAGVAATHFKGKGVLFEIWNEPNIGFWQPKPNVDEYAALALETAKAVKEADPKAMLLAPGTSGFPWDFFETVFRSGILSYLDGVSIHPYRGQEPESAAADYARLRGLIARYAPKGKRQMPIVSSEWGYTTFAAGPITEAVQAQYLTRMWLANLASGVNLSIFYDWKEDGTDPKEGEHHFGMVHPDLTPKPSFTAAKNLISALRGFHFRHRLQTANENDWQLLFQKGDTGELRLITWSADRNAPAAPQTPKVRSVDPKDVDYRDLLRLASVRYSYGAWAEATDEPPLFTVTFHNPDKKQTLMSLQLFEDAAQKIPTGAVGAAVQPGESHTMNGPWSTPITRDQRAPLPVKIKWDGEILKIAPYPLTAQRTDPLFISPVPSQTDLAVYLENPAGTAFEGIAVLREGTKIKARREVNIAAGQTIARISLPHPGRNSVRVELQDAKGAMVAVSPALRFSPLPGFPKKPTDESGYNDTLFVENAAQKPTPLKAVAAPKGSPAETLLRFPYHFDAGWRYSEWSPVKLTTIPTDAKALTLWVYCDPSANAAPDALRARFRDATGQTFLTSVR